MDEIRVKAKNCTNMTIKNGMVVVGKVKYPKWQRFLIWLGLRKHEIFSIDGEVKGVDTSSFKHGDVLYLDPDKPGNFITKKPDNERKN